MTPKTSIAASLLATPALVVALFVAPTASAQEPAPLPPPGPPQATTSFATSTTAPVPATTVVASSSSEHVTFTADTPDHERFVNRFAVGFFGVRTLPIADGSGARQGLDAPIVGLRYWLSRDLGLDLGVGFGYASGGTENAQNGTSVTTSSPSTFGFAAHGGVPIALAHGRHFSFLVIPEANVAVTTGSAGDTSLSGFLLNLGGRIGGEIHFGFIGVPELSLQGSVGVGVQRASWKASLNNVSQSGSTFTFGTTVQADPWAIFTNNISAFYYF